VRGYSVERSLDWSDPVNLVGEGLFLPERTRPSTAVAHVKDADLKGGAGEVMTRGSGPERSEWYIGVVKLGSAAKARALQKWLHGQDLEQPCFSECIFSPQNAALPGVPGGRMVIQMPNLPGGGSQGPPPRYLFEFTDGAYLYFASGDADAKARGEVEARARAFYRRVSRQKD
jgi:hypothetical protein